MKTLLVMMLLLGCSVAQKCKTKPTDWCYAESVKSYTTCDPIPSGYTWDENLCRWVLPQNTDDAMYNGASFSEWNKRADSYDASVAGCKANNWKGAAKPIYSVYSQTFLKISCASLRPLSESNLPKPTTGGMKASLMELGDLEQEPVSASCAPGTGCRPTPRKCQTGVIWEGHEVCMATEREHRTVKSISDCVANDLVNYGADGSTQCESLVKRIYIDGKVVWKE